MIQIWIAVILLQIKALVLAADHVTFFEHSVKNTRAINSVQFIWHYQPAAQGVQGFLAAVAGPAIACDTNNKRFCNT